LGAAVEAGEVDRQRAQNPQRNSRAGKLMTDRTDEDATSAEGDVIIPNACTRGMKGRVGTTDYSELGGPGGHVGTFVGGKAQKILAPSIATWLRERS
jgi:hypothetical protein